MRVLALLLLSFAAIAADEPTLLIGEQCYTVQEMEFTPSLYCYKQKLYGPYTHAAIPYTVCEGKQIWSPKVSVGKFYKPVECPADLVAPAPVEGIVYDGPNTRLVWQVPPENEDGSPLTDLAGFRVYCGLGNRTVGPTETIWPIHPALTGLIACAVTAIDTSGNESVVSEVVGFYREPEE